MRSSVFALYYRPVLSENCNPLLENLKAMAVISLISESMRVIGPWTAGAKRWHSTAKGKGDVVS